MHSSVNKFTIRKSRLYFGFLAICWGFLLGLWIKTTIGFFIKGFTVVNEEKQNFPDYNLGTILTLGFFGICLWIFLRSAYYLINPKPKLVISENGLWSKKYPNIQWKDIYYVCKEITNDKYKLDIVVIKLVNTDDDSEKVIKIESYMHNINYEKFKQIVLLYKGAHEVSFLD